MAVDTRSRRAACLGIALAATLTLPLSDGTVGQPDRQHVALCYPGIDAATPVSAVPDYIIICEPDVNRIICEPDPSTVKLG